MLMFDLKQKNKIDLIQSLVKHIKINNADLMIGLSFLYSTQVFVYQDRLQSTNSTHPQEKTNKLSVTKGPFGNL